MTREEAIEYLDGMKIVIPICNELKELTDERNTAIDMAIEALSAKPQTDLISRADAIEAVCKGCHWWSGQCDNDKAFRCDEVCRIEALPSADAVEYESTVTLNSPISISAYGSGVHTSEYVKLEQEYEMLQSAYDEQNRVIDGLQAIIDNYKAESADADVYEDYEHATLVDIKEPLKVLVVRCKDCLYKQLMDEGDTKYYYCALEDRPNRNWSVDDTDYCSWGERSGE